MEGQKRAFKIHRHGQGAQDLLIRLYPESFFAGMALRIGVFMLGGLVLVYLAVGLLARKIARRFDRGGNPNAV